MPESIQKLIQNKYLKSHNQISSSFVCRIAGEEIAKILKKNSQSIKVLSFDGQRLKLSIKGPLVSHRTKMSEEKIKEKIKEKIQLKTLDIVYSPSNND